LVNKIILTNFKRKLLDVVTNMNLTDYFLWVASDGWGTKKGAISANNQAAESAITFSPKFYEIKGIF
jgi:hypothetical protein